MLLSIKLVYIALCCMLLGVLLSIGILAQAPLKAQIAFSSNRDGNYEIYVMDFDGKNQRNLTNDPADDWAPAWSPDGKMIAFSRRLSERDRSQIHVMDADGKNQSNLTSDSVKGYYTPSWSPDGQKIAFAYAESTLGGFMYGIAVIDVNGKNQRDITIIGGLHEAHNSPSWSPCAQLIAFTSWDMMEPPLWEDWDPRKSEVFVMDADGKNCHNLTSNSWYDGEPAWSPDGKMIAFTSFRDDNFEIYVMDADGKNQTRLTNNSADDSSPDWFDPAYVITAVSPAGKLGTSWGNIKAKW